MKLKFNLLFLASVLLFGCKHQNESNFTLPWMKIEERGRGTQINILIEKADKVDYLILGHILKNLKDSFKINTHLKIAPAEKMADILLADSKHGRKSFFDLVIGSGEVMEELDRLGLLYSNFHAAIPNFKNISLEAIRYLSKNNTSRIYFTPVYNKCQVLVYDSVKINKPQSLRLNDSVYIFTSSDAVRTSFLLAKNNSKFYQNSLDTIKFLELLENNRGQDSLLASLKKRIVSQEKIKKERLKQIIMPPYSFEEIRLNSSYAKFKSSEIPCFYTCAGISNTSNNVFGAMILINYILGEETQLKNETESLHYFMPIVKIGEKSTGKFGK